MKRLSLQWRITLMTALLIAGACICLNLLLYRSGASGMDKGFRVKDGKASVKKRHLKARFYNDWTHDYATMYCYVPDIDFQYKLVLNGELNYQPIRIAFIEL